ncbi:MAG: heteromeric transposase endonuclease subunit TnsA, partial [Crocosphaera sp.]
EKKSVVEKLELERRYYLQQNIDWGIITEKGISPIFANNIGWIHSSYHLEPSIDAELPELYPIANILLEVKCYQGRKNIYKLLMTPEKWM